MVSVSWFFAIECKGLLIGEGLHKKDLQVIHQILIAENEVNSFEKPLSMYLGPNQVLLTLEVNFSDHLHADDIEKSIDALESKIKEALPQVNRIYIEAETIQIS